MPVRFFVVEFLVAWPLLVSPIVLSSESDERTTTGTLLLGNFFCKRGGADILKKGKRVKKWKACVEAIT